MHSKEITLFLDVNYQSAYIVSNSSISTASCLINETWVKGDVPLMEFM